MDLPLIIEIINEGPGVPREGPEPKPADPVRVDLIQRPRFVNADKLLHENLAVVVRPDVISREEPGSFPVPVQDVNLVVLVD